MSARKLSWLIAASLIVLTVGCASTPTNEASSTGEPAMSDHAPNPSSVSDTRDTERVLGSWSGDLDAGGVILPVVFHIVAQDDGTLGATMDSPSQGAFGLEVASVSLSGSMLSLDIRFVQARYEGQVSPSYDAIEGTFIQGGGRFSLNLSRLEAQDGQAEGRSRPQDPRPPFPYAEEEVVFENTDAGISLAATLTVPAGPAPAEGYSAVVLVSGSGQQNRDEEIFNHRPFRVLADSLSRAGIAVLRYDDRGIGGSEGGETLATATTFDFAADAAAALSFLHSRHDLNPAAIGILGHSEGGVIATMLAGGETASPVRPAFVIQLGGTAIPGSDVLLTQSVALLRANGVPESSIEAISAANASIYEILLSDRTAEESWEETSALLSSLGVPAEQLESQRQQLYHPWFRTFLGYDPRRALRTYAVPILALFGELDLQVTEPENRLAMESALALAPTTDVTIVTIPTANHLFQPATRGTVDEYATIETTMMPEVLETIAGWINDRF